MPGTDFDFFENVEPAAAPIPLDRIGAVGDLLQLAQHEMGHYQRPFQESGLADVGDAAVNDDAGVENFVGFPARSGR